MRIVASKARYPVRIHSALDEIIALHSILMRSPFREMSERCLTQLVFFQFPEVAQTFAHFKSHRPVISVSLGRRDQPLSLRMTLNAGVSRVDIVKA